MNNEIEVKIPYLLTSTVFAPDVPRGTLRYRLMHGGRGSAKSKSAAMMSALFGFAEPLRIMCCRQFQNSIKQSFYSEVKSAIETQDFLSNFYEIGEKSIKGANGTEYMFMGLERNISSVKSTADIDILIIEEAEDVSERAYVDVEPTIRNPGSEIWVIWNPKKKNSPTDVRFRQNNPPRSRIVEINYRDNPFFPLELEEQRLYQKEIFNPELYSHIWEGEYLEESEAQIFKGKYEIDEFEPQKNWDGPYYGMDFGFSKDPTTGVKCWIHDKCLYIEHDAGKVGLELDETAEFLSKNVPGIDSKSCRADSARPECISYLKRHGMPLLMPTKKWPGSVEEGIMHLKSYKKIIVHPRCKETIKEFRYYSFKVDRLSGEVTDQIIDEYNHYIDAIRYALCPIIKNTGFDWSKYE